MRKINIILLLLITPLVFAKSKLPILSSKQSAVNLRFFTSTGKNTYYQRRSGSLLMSTNYKVTEIAKAQPGSHFLLSATRSRKRIIGQINESFHSSYDLRAPKKIFVLPYGGIKFEEIGEGISPKLHLDDQWATFYRHQSRTIFIKSLLSEVLNYSIKINNKLHAYFVPQVILTSPKRVVFTDVNSKGIQGLIFLDKDTGDLAPLFKVDNTTKKIELCTLSESQIVMGIFPLVSSDDSSSEISIIDTKTLDTSKRTVIYTSRKEDIGNMICSIDGKNIFFIKDQSTSDRIIMNSVELNVATKQLAVLSDVGDATNMTYIDGMLLLPNKGKLLILKGHTSLKEVDLIGN